MNCSNIKIGDHVRIHNRTANVMLQSGHYDVKVVDADAHSFAVEGFDKWWFYRDTGESYVGDAIVTKNPHNKALNLTSSEAE